MRFCFSHFRSSNSISLGPIIGARLIQSAIHPLTCPPREPSYGHVCLSHSIGFIAHSAPPDTKRHTVICTCTQRPRHRRRIDRHTQRRTHIRLRAAGNQVKPAEHQRSKHEKGFHAIHCLEPGCGQSEIRTRGRLPFNGFQDRLFRPLRHLSNAHNARNVNIAQHSEIIRIATRKSASSVAKCRPTIPKTTQHDPNATVREYPTNPSIPKTTQHDPMHRYGDTRPTQVSSYLRKPPPSRRHGDTQPTQLSPKRRKPESRRPEQPDARHSNPVKGTATGRTKPTAAQSNPPKHRSGANITLTPLPQCNHKPNRLIQQVGLSRIRPPTWSAR